MLGKISRVCYDSIGRVGDASWMILSEYSPAGQSALGSSFVYTAPSSLTILFFIFSMLYTLATLLFTRTSKLFPSLITYFSFVTIIILDDFDGLWKSLSLPFIILHFYTYVIFLAFRNYTLTMLCCSCKKVSTISGSNWVPEHVISSFTASSWVMAFL
jgi:hypothetical protein